MTVRDPLGPFERPLHPSWLALLSICLMGAGAGALLGGGRALAGAAFGLGMVAGGTALERGRRLASGRSDVERAPLERAP